MLEHESISFQGARHASDPYEIVAAAFADFTTENGRGGVPRPEKPPYLIDEVGKSFRGVSDDYHVEMTFTDEQRAYVVTAMAYFNALLEGKVFVDNAPVLPRLSDRMLQPEKKKEGFSRAMLFATQDTINDFADFYPNLMPAMDAVFRLAGTEGTVTALSLATKIASEKLSPEVADQEGHFSHRKFVGPHTGKETGDPFMYEVLCAGEAVAKTMLHESMSVMDAFDMPSSRIDEEGFKLRITLQIQGISREIASSQQNVVYPIFVQPEIGPQVDEDQAI